MQLDSALDQDYFVQQASSSGSLSPCGAVRKQDATYCAEVGQYCAASARVWASQSPGY